MRLEGRSRAGSPEEKQDGFRERRGLVEVSWEKGLGVAAMFKVAHQGEGCRGFLFIPPSPGWRGDSFPPSRSIFRALPSWAPSAGSPAKSCAGKPAGALEAWVSSSLGVY